MRRRKIQFCVNVEPPLFEKIETSRGITKRATFVEHIIKEKFEGTL